MTGELFGDPDKMLVSDKSPEYQYKKLAGRKAEIPRIYLACGTEDALIDANRRFRDFLREQDADLIYEEGPGKHNWVFWNEYLDRGLKAILSK
jgi:S-formylglutathione hydrolase FrmB